VVADTFATAGGAAIRPARIVLPARIAAGGDMSLSLENWASGKLAFASVAAALLTSACAAATPSLDSAQPLTEYRDGSWLLSRCDPPLDDPAYQEAIKACGDYILGIFDGYQATITRQVFISKESVTFICIKGPFNLREYREIVVSHLRSVETSKATRAHHLVLDALRLKFPCPSQMDAP
jgi:hypothetical protein